MNLFQLLTSELLLVDLTLHVISSRRPASWTTHIPCWFYWLQGTLPASALKRSLSLTYNVYFLLFSASAEVKHNAGDGAIVNVIWLEASQSRFNIRPCSRRQQPPGIFLVIRPVGLEFRIAQKSIIRGYRQRQVTKKTLVSIPLAWQSRMKAWLLRQMTDDNSRDLSCLHRTWMLTGIYLTDRENSTTTN